MSPVVLFRFRLYVAGTTPNSEKAARNLNALCRAHLPGAYKIEMVDVMRNPERALIDGIYMTPTLIKLSPSPVRMIVGTLDRSESLLESLGIAASTTAAV